MAVESRNVGDVRNDEERVKDAVLVAQRDDQTPDLAEWQPRVADWLEFTRAAIGLSPLGRGPSVLGSCGAKATKHINMCSQVNPRLILLKSGE